MDSIVVFNDGLDIVAYTAGHDTQYSATWFVVHSGGGIIVYVWGNILCMAQVEV